MLTFQSLTESHRSEKATIKCITTVVLDASDTTNQLQKTEKSGAELAANFPGSWLPPSGKSLGWLRGRLTSHRPAGITGPVYPTTTCHGGQATSTAMTGLSQVSTTTSGWLEAAYVCWEISLQQGHSCYDAQADIRFFIAEDAPELLIHLLSAGTTGTHLALWCQRRDAVRALRTLRFGECLRSACQDAFYTSALPSKDHGSCRPCQPQRETSQAPEES